MHERKGTKNASLWAAEGSFFRVKKLLHRSNAERIVK